MKLHAPFSISVRRSRSASAAKTRVQDLLSMAEIYGMASEELTKRWLELRKEFNLPAYEWSYLSGYMDARRDRWYFEKLVFRYTLSDGRLVKFDPAMPEWEKTEITTLGVSGHYWEHNMRPYFVGSNATDRQAIAKTQA